MKTRAKLILGKERLRPYLDDVKITEKATNQFLPQFFRPDLIGRPTTGQRLNNDYGAGQSREPPLNLLARSAIGGVELIGKKGEPYAFAKQSNQRPGRWDEPPVGQWDGVQQPFPFQGLNRSECRMAAEEARKSRNKGQLAFRIASPDFMEHRSAHQFISQSSTDRVNAQTGALERLAHRPWPATLNRFGGPASSEPAPQWFQGPIPSPNNRFDQARGQSFR
ncbi:MAG TPA: hypothetical protein VK961_06540 [Chthoniobacter sp.]|nr:hypothetical protein [Chthoniobacter sp.]